MIQVLLLPKVFVLTEVTKLDNITTGTITIAAPNVADTIEGT